MANYKVIDLLLRKAYKKGSMAQPNGLAKTETVLFSKP